MAKAKTRSTPKPALRHGRLMLTAEQAETLIEIATLVYYSDGFTYTKPMMALNRCLANIARLNYRRACLAEAAAREHAYVVR